MARTLGELNTEIAPLLAAEAKRIREGLALDSVVVIVTGQSPDGEDWFCNYASAGNLFAVAQSAQNYLDDWAAAQCAEAED